MEYKVGYRIRIIRMAGEPQYSGREGIITNIDDIGKLHGTWGGCAVILAEAELEILELGGKK